MYTKQWSCVFPRHVGDKIHALFYVGKNDFFLFLSDRARWWHLLFPRSRLVSQSPLPNILSGTHPDFWQRLTVSPKTERCSSFSQVRVDYLSRSIVGQCSVQDYNLPGEYSFLTVNVKEEGCFPSKSVSLLSWLSQVRRTSGPSEVKTKGLGRT